MEYWGTLGPACADENILRQMLDAGMTGMRLNLSHGTLREAAGLLELYRKAGSGRLMMDLQGRELRTANAQPMEVLAGQIVPLEAFMDPELARNADVIRIEDGSVELRRQEEGWSSVHAGVIRPRKGMAVVGKKLDLPLLTEEDRHNLADAKAFGVDAVMVPFVQDGAMVHAYRKLAPGLRLYAKIEDCVGLAHAAEILEAADVTVIARGDLGMQVPLEQMGVMEDRILELAKAQGRQVMVVTQMLDSMREHPVPTRAEIVDIHHAVKEGASALMLTGETAAGRYPAEAMAWLIRTGNASRQKSWYSEETDT